MPFQFAVESLDSFTSTLSSSVMLTQTNNWVTPMPRIETSLLDTVSLAAHQTPFKNQLDRGTCWAFAGIAALEAAYKRLHGLDLDLSEQYLFHSTKAHESDFGSHSLMGFQGSSDIIKHMERIRVPTEADAPYLTNATMVATIPAAATVAGVASPTQEQRDAFEFDNAHIPIAARANCRYGVRTAGVLTNFSITDLENLIASNHEVVVNVTVNGGGHVVLLIGYNKRLRYFLAKNSWGETDFIRIKYENDPAWTINMSIAHYIVEVIDPAPDLRSSWLGTWNMDHDGWRGSLVLRRFTDLRSTTDADQPGGATKLGSYYRDGQKQDVTGYFEHGGQTLRMTLAGQEHTLSIFSNTNSLAAGTTTWSGISFGSRIQRGAIPATEGKAFDKVDWLGTWEMNHDGWRGILTVDGIDAASGGVGASYARSSGEVLPANGAIQPQQHAMDLTINFGPDNPNQPFTLLHHTWEKGYFSGQTTWAGRPFGVLGTKTADKAAWRTFELAGAGSSSSAPSLAAVSRVPNSMEVWWIGNGGSVEAAFWYDGGSWTRYQLGPVNSASRDSGIAAVSRIPGSMEVWWIGPRGSVEAAFWYEDGQWTRYQIAPDGSASPAGGIAAVSRIPNSMEIWWVGMGGSVEAAFWYEGGQWTRYQIAPDGSAGTTSEIAVVSRIPTSMELWWTTPDGAIEAAFWYEGGQWTRYRLADPGSSVSGGGIAVVSRVPNSMELWWLGSTGSIEAAFWYEGGQWTRYQIAPSGGAAPQSGIAAVSRIPNSMELWWAGPDQSLQAAFWYEGGQWTRYQLDNAGMANQPFAAVVVSRVPKSMEVWWSGIGGSIRDSYYYDLI